MQQGIKLSDDTLYLLSHFPNRFKHLLSKKQQNDKETLLQVVTQNGLNLKYIDNDNPHKHDPEIILKAMESLFYPNNPCDILSHVIKKVNNNETFMIEATKIYLHAFEMANENLKNNKTFIKKLIFQHKIHPAILQYASSQIRNDIEFLLEIDDIYSGYFKQDDYTPLYFMDDALKNNYNCIFRLIIKNPNNLLYASDKLKDNAKLVQIAIHCNPICIKYASYRLRQMTKEEIKNEANIRL